MATDTTNRHGLFFDARMVATVAGVLVGIHGLVPVSLRHELALQYGRPDPLHALTAAYVHPSDAHLSGNVAGLLVGGPWALVVSHLARERRWFRLSLLWMLPALPIAVGMTGAAIVGGPLTTRGFSGVVAGLVGFGLVAVGVVLHRTFGADRWLAWNVVAGLTVVVAPEIIWPVIGSVWTATGGTLALAFGLTLIPVGRAALGTGLRADRNGWARLAGAVVTTGLQGVLVVAFVFGLIPPALAAGGSITNILGHYLALVYWAVIAGGGYRYWSIEAP